MRNSVLCGVVMIAAIVARIPFDHASAQGEIGIQARDDALRRIQALEEQERTAVAAGRYKRIEGGPVSLDQVLRNPDDIELNLRYAQTQVADGNLRGAAATIERILILNPNLTRMRLFYAFILFRLDSLTEAQAQISLLESAELAAADQAELDSIRARIEERTRRTTVSATLTAGVTYQSNANFAPESERVDIIVNAGGVPLAIRDIPVDGPEGDLAYLASARVGFVHDLGYQEGHQLFGSANLLWNDQVVVDTADYTDYTFDLGGVHRARWGDVTARLLAGHFSLKDDSFLTDFGVDLNWERRYFDDALVTNVRHRSMYEDYDGADGSTRERTGGRFEFELGASYRLTSSQRIGARVEYEIKDAKEAWREYDRLEFGLRHLWLLNRGRYLSNTVSYGHDLYEAANPRVSGSRRQDDELVYRFTISSPLSSLIRGLPRTIGDIRISGSAEYQRTDSNIQNFEFENVTGEILFSKRLSF